MSSFAVGQWLSDRPDAVSLLVGASAVETRSAGEGRGLGVFAVREIPAFSHILSDPITCLMKPTDDLPQLYDRFLALSEAQRAQYLSLSYRADQEKDSILTWKLLERGHTMDDVPRRIQVGHIMQNNAFNVDLGGSHGAGHRALFQNVARINHSCAPNAHVSFYPKEGRMAVHTLRPILSGEEVLISYFSILLPRVQRQSRTRKWGFDCSCSACDTSQSAHGFAEGTRKAFADFKDEYESIMKTSRTSPKALRSIAGKGLALATRTEKDSSLRPALPDLYDELGMLEAKLLLSMKRENERDGIVAYLEKSVIWEARITGRDSAATKNRLDKLRQFAAKQGDQNRPQVAEQYKTEYDVVWGPD